MDGILVFSSEAEEWNMKKKREFEGEKCMCQKLREKVIALEAVKEEKTGNKVEEAKYWNKEVIIVVSWREP